MLLRKQGLGRRRIAKRTGISTNTIQSWINGHKPRSAWTEEEIAEYGHKLSQSKWEEKNPMWKGDKVNDNSARQRAIRRFPVPKGYQRHHIDGNPKNNDPSNILIVTAKQHMIEDGRMELLRKGIKRSKLME